MAFHDPVARNCTPADDTITTAAGHRYTNHGPLLFAEVKPGAVLMFPHEGHLYVATVTAADADQVQFAGDPRWLNPLGMYLLTKER